MDISSRVFGEICIACVVAVVAVVGVVSLLTMAWVTLAGGG